MAIPEDIDAKFRWLDKTEYPFTSNFYNLNGHNLHYIDEGHGETILFVHGTPSWSFDFRNVIKILKSSFRCIAIDHIGFGELWARRQSIADKPALFIWGMKDPIIKKHYLEKFVSGFTNSTTVELETCGHFPQEEQPEEVMKAISNLHCSSR